MPFHHWNDTDFDWQSLYMAIDEATNIMQKFGRIGVHSKEKFGTARWTIDLCDGTLHSMTHPGYVYSQYPNWLWRFDVTCRPLRFFAPLIRLWQRKVVKFAFNYVCNKYPHIDKEIVMDAPEELLSEKLRILRNSLWQKVC
jgi:hypothetical protein